MTDRTRTWEDKTRDAMFRSAKKWGPRAAREAIDQGERNLYQYLYEAVQHRLAKLSLNIDYEGRMDEMNQTVHNILSEVVPGLFRQYLDALMSARIEEGRTMKITVGKLKRLIRESAMSPKDIRDEIELTQMELDAELQSGHPDSDEIAMLKADLELLYGLLRDMKRGGEPQVESLLHESMLRHCDMYKASDGKWYLELAHDEYGERWDADTYGPFSSQQAVDDFLERFPNPGGMGVDDSGEQPPPTESPNGSPVIKPKSRGMYW